MKSSYKRSVFLKKTGISLMFIISMALVGCSSDKWPVLGGSYQNESMKSGYFIYLVFYPENSSFIELMDNKEVDRGTYEEKSDHTYLLKSGKQEFEINLTKEDTFEIVNNQINGGEPVQLKNTSKNPGEISTEYENLLDKK